MISYSYKYTFRGEAKTSEMSTQDVINRFLSHDRTNNYERVSIETKIERLVEVVAYIANVANVDLNEIMSSYELGVNSLKKCTTE